MRKLFSLKRVHTNLGKRLLLVLALGAGLMSFLNLNAQTFNGDLSLATQAQVDAFNFTSVTGKLTIINSSISNLNGLSELQTVGGVFEITNTALTNIDALSSLQSVNSLFIRGNSLLANLNGFSSLTTVPGGFRFENNGALVNFDGLLSVTGIVAGIYISTCPMTSLNGFSSISDITGFIELENNLLLTNVDGLQGLQGADVVNSIKIIGHPLLQNINGLLSIKDAGEITITGNQILPNLDGLANLNTVAGMIISQNPALSNIDGLSNIKTMSQSLWIRSNSSLTNINGLGSLTTVSKELIVDGDNSLTNIDGLTSLSKIGTNLIIGLNSNLVNLDGLENLIEIGKDLKITSNRNLTDFCGLTKLFTTGTIVGIVDISNNGANTVSLSVVDVTVNNDANVCGATLTEAAIGNATAAGCLKPGTPTHTDFPTGNSFPVGTTSITWSVTDGAGNTATATQKIVVVDNQNPVITGSPSNTTVSCAADVPAADISLVTATDNCSATITHVGDIKTNETCANRFTLTRTYKATDPSGNYTTATQVITVNDNVAPQITGLNVSKQVLTPPNHKMQDITIGYTVTDNCVSSPVVTITVTSNEPDNGTGDGDTDNDIEIIDNNHIRLRAERSANGSGRIYKIVITANDGCNSISKDSIEVRVPHNIKNPHSGQAFLVGSTVSFTGEFWDKPGNKHTAKWMIDDNTYAKATVTEPAGSKNGKISGSYKFTSAGVYKLQMNITDQTGLTTYTNTSGDLEAIVVIYDPNGGYTYGGGWFNSPAGALKSNATVTGKVSYGFTMNYFKNATLPKGETQFEFKVGSFEFNALNFEYMVISNSMAQLKGTGKIIGGQSGINFIMTVVDGNLDGTGIDKIRMKIYNKNTGEVYYDNQPDASDAALPTQAVGVNSTIVISGSNSILTSANPNVEREQIVDEHLNNLKVFAYPNPTNTNFTLNIKDNTSEKITIQVIDVYGRLIEIRNVTANSTFRFGENYQQGVYFINLIQGKEHKEMKLIKLSK